jgi:hypothetical protein
MAQDMSSTPVGLIVKREAARGVVPQRPICLAPDYESGVPRVT